jgi:hypothetical protein
MITLNRSLINKGVYMKNEVGSHKTSVIMDNDNVLMVTYHNTIVVKVSDDEIVLNSGGWQTSTTKRRMNQASLQYNLGFSVYQSDFCWYVSYNGDIIPFKDNMILKRGVFYPAIRIVN